MENHHWTDEDESLLGELWEHGVHYLSGARDARDSAKGIAPSDLVLRLATHPHPRMRHSLIALLLFHPEWSVDLPQQIVHAPQDQQRRFRVLYTAAVYLQRLWWSRLRMYLGTFPRIPDLYSQELDLPSAEERHGKVGLHALADQETRRSGLPLNYLSSYEKVMQNVFGQLEAEKRIDE